MEEMWYEKYMAMERKAMALDPSDLEEKHVFKMKKQMP